MRVSGFLFVAALHGITLAAAETARYWKVKAGTVTKNHCPRAGQIRFMSGSGTVHSTTSSAGTTLVANNCDDSGWIFNMVRPAF